MDKNEAIEEFRKALVPGMLTEEEIEELINYSFYKTPESVDEQVRYYYLKLKNTDIIRDQENAKQMLSEIGQIISGEEQVNTLDGVKDVCLILGKYIHGFLINYDGKQYTVRREKVGEVSDLYPELYPLNKQKQRAKGDLVDRLSNLLLQYSNTLE